MIKEQTLAALQAFQEQLKKLRSSVRSLKTAQVSRKEIRDSAEIVASFWVENLRSPLEYRFKLPSDVVEEFSFNIKRLFVLSRPNNQKSSYLEVIDALLDSFDDKLVLPVQTFAALPASLSSLENILATVPSGAASEYITESLRCAASANYRAAIVLAWCGVIDKLQTKVISLGYPAFNAASAQMKMATAGKFKHFNKLFSISTLSGLQEIFDNDLISVLEHMQVFDGNQADRLRTCFGYRNQSAHPGNAPIGEPHLIVFYADIVSIVLSSPAFA